MATSTPDFILPYNNMPMARCSSSTTNIAMCMKTATIISIMVTPFISNAFYPSAGPKQLCTLVRVRRYERRLFASLHFARAGWSTLPRMRHLMRYSPQNTGLESEQLPKILKPRAPISAFLPIRTDYLLSAHVIVFQAVRL